MGSLRTIRAGGDFEPSPSASNSLVSIHFPLPSPLFFPLFLAPRHPPGPTGIKPAAKKGGNQKQNRGKRTWGFPEPDAHRVLGDITTTSRGPDPTNPVRLLILGWPKAIKTAGSIQLFSRRGMNPGRTAPALRYPRLTQGMAEPVSPGYAHAKAAALPDPPDPPRNEPSARLFMLV